jgi:hypothetical protein
MSETFDNYREDTYTDLVNENARLRAELEKYQLRKYHKTFTEEFKENVRTFFGRKCVLCGKPETELDRRLSIHHVEYKIREDCYKTPSVPLCDDCHNLPHAKISDHSHWIKFFNELIQSQYGGKWCYSKKEFALMRNLDPKIKRNIETYPGFNRGGRCGERVSEKALVKFISGNLHRKKNTPRSPHIVSKIKKNITYMVCVGLLIIEVDKGKRFIRKVVSPSE